MKIDEASRLVEKAMVIGTDSIDKVASTTAENGIAITLSSTVIVIIVAIVIVFLGLFVWLIIKTGNTKAEIILLKQHLLQRITEVIHGIKKELDIDDLQKLVIEVKSEVEKNRKLLHMNSEKNENNRENLGIGIINIQNQINEIKTDLDNKTQTIIDKISTVDSNIDKQSLVILARIIEDHKRLEDIIVKGKEWSNQEMFTFLLTKFQLSISNISTHFISKVHNNNLFIKRDLIENDVWDDINKMVTSGRTFIYTVNYDSRILDTVFSNTDKAMEVASKAVLGAFRSFWDKGEDYIKEHPEEYNILEQRIEAIANKVATESENMLKKYVLGSKK